MPELLSPIKNRRISVENISLLESEIAIRRIRPIEGISLGSIEGKNDLTNLKAVHRKLMYEPRGNVPLAMMNNPSTMRLNVRESSF